MELIRLQYKSNGTGWKTYCIWPCQHLEALCQLSNNLVVMGNIEESIIVKDTGELLHRVRRVDESVSITR